MKYFVEKEDFIFNTRVYQKICYDNNDIKTKEIEEIAEKATKLMRQFEEKLSFFYESSEVSSINENASNGFIKISNDTFEILKKSIYYSKLTNGIFDITIAPLVKAWKINSDNPVILDDDKYSFEDTYVSHVRNTVGIIFASYMYELKDKDIWNLNDHLYQLEVADVISYLNLEFNSERAFDLTEDSYKKLEKSYKDNLKRLW